MEAADYWLMASEYGIWNTAIASLQFWAEDLDLVSLGMASECVYTTFFWTNRSHPYANYLKTFCLDVLSSH